MAFRSNPNLRDFAVRNRMAGASGRAMNRRTGQSSTGRHRVATPILAFAFLFTACPQILLAAPLARKEPAWDSAGTPAALARQNRRGPTVAYGQMPPGSP